MSKQGTHTEVEDPVYFTTLYLTSLNQLVLILQTLFTFFTKQATLNLDEVVKGTEFSLLFGVPWSKEKNPFV